MARKFLETFLAFTIPSRRLFKDQLDELFKKNKKIEITKKERIYNFLNTKSHFFPESVEGFDLENLHECREVIQNIMLLVEEANENHYKELCRCLK